MKTEGNKLLPIYTPEKNLISSSGMLLNGPYANIQLWYDENNSITGEYLQVLRSLNQLLSIHGCTVL